MLSQESKEGVFQQEKEEEEKIRVKALRGQHNKPEEKEHLDQNMWATGGEWLDASALKKSLASRLASP